MCCRLPCCCRWPSSPVACSARPGPLSRPGCRPSAAATSSSPPSCSTSSPPHWWPICWWRCSSRPDPWPPRVGCSPRRAGCPSWAPWRPASGWKCPTARSTSVSSGRWSVRSWCGSLSGIPAGVTRSGRWGRARVPPPTRASPIPEWWSWPWWSPAC